MNDKRDVTLTLEYPVRLADRTVTEVTMRRPTLGDLLVHSVKGTGDIEGEVGLVGALCGLKPEEMRLLDARDYFLLQEQLLQFRNGPRR